MGVKIFAIDLKVHGHQDKRIHLINFPKSAEFSDNFDSNIGAHFLSTRINLP